MRLSDKLVNFIHNQNHDEKSNNLINVFFRAKNRIMEPRFILLQPDKTLSGTETILLKNCYRACQ